jgi:FtsP/CotA-like multicopper oxidase with cupredoxin domain
VSSLKTSSEDGAVTSSSMTNEQRPSRAHTTVSRRTVLGGALGVGATTLLGSLSMMERAAASVSGTLPVPPLLQPTLDKDVQVFPLQMATGTTEILPGVASPTAGFNGAFLGPTMRISERQKVRFSVTNNLAEQTTVHWHGLHIAPSMDGGPQNIIAAGTTWSPEFTVKQSQSCTLWYHPHGLGTTARQVSLGLVGMIIVDDRSPAGASLPRDYGRDDFPLIMQSTAVLADGSLAQNNGGFTAAGSTLQLLVNGTGATAATPTLTVDRGRVRLRLLNASLVDTITVARADGAAFTQVASDAGLLTAPLAATSVRLVHGERAEILLDLTPGAAVTLQATVQNAVDAVRYTVPIAAVSTASPAAPPPPPLPRTLNTIVPLDTTNALTRTLTLNNTGAIQMINGIAGTSITTLHDNMLMTGLNDIEVWDVFNATAALHHSFHLHDVPYQVISIDGVAASGANLGWKDTIEVPPGTTVRIAMQFTDFTDSEYMYMLHCHNLVHEDAGMMLGLMVSP